MANEEHLAILKQGVNVWNEWTKKHWEVRPTLSLADLRRANLSFADLSGADLIQADLSHANLHGANFRYANLSHANLHGANFRYADLSGADLHGAHLSFADLSHANLRRADLTRADLRRADLRKADLRRADLHGGYLSGADLSFADLTRADLSEADLTRSILIETTFSDANLTGCHIYGISVWSIKGQPNAQSNLIITRRNEPTITVDNLEVAQFVYLLLDNQRIRDVISTITSKAVLILGRFTPRERKAILDAVRDALRTRGYVPIMFDFDPSASRDLTETIQLLASMAKFVVADLTDAKSIPQELSHIVPFLPSVPVQPILLAAQREYAIFEHWRSFPWVLKEFIYQDQADLLAHLEDGVIAPAEQRLQGHSAEAALQAAILKNEELQRQLAELQNALQRQREAEAKA